MKPGVYLFGLMAIATGIMNLVWREFETAHEPIQAFGDNIPGRDVLACIVAVFLIAGGAAVLWRRGTKAGAVILGAVYLLFALFHAPRFYTAPHILGFRAGVFIGVANGMCQQLILVAAAVLVYASASKVRSKTAGLLARWIFGLSCIDFGLSHLTGIAANARFVPAWMPMGQGFWVGFTGCAFILAGIAIISAIADIAAARLLALMLLVFSALALAPLIAAFPNDHIAWGSNAYNLAAVAAAWILAEWLAGRRAAFTRSL